MQASNIFIENSSQTPNDQIFNSLEKCLRIFQSLSYSVQNESKMSKSVIFENVHKATLPQSMTLLKTLVNILSNQPANSNSTVFASIASLVQYILEYILATFSSFKTNSNHFQNPNFSPKINPKFKKNKTLSWG